MPKIPLSKVIRGELVFLGTGTSHGVPMIGCGCPTCTSTDPRNQRTRCAVVLGLPAGNLLIDTPPDLRIQLTRERIGMLHAVLYTHSHADHLFGLDDVRILSRYLDADVPVYCEKEVEQLIRRTFAYAFDPAARAYPAGGVPRLEFHTIGTEPFKLLGARVTPIRLSHGCQPTLGFRFGNLAYCTDAKRIPPESMELLAGLDVLILDCLREEPHLTHMNVEEALQVIGRLRPKRALFTHISHRLEHQATAGRLPPGVELAYDGLHIPLELDR